MSICLICRLASYTLLASVSQRRIQWCGLGKGTINEFAHRGPQKGEGAMKFRRALSTKRAHSVIRLRNIKKNSKELLNF